MRKFSLSLILIILIFACYEVVFGSSEAIRQKVAGVNEIAMASKKLNTEVASLEKSSTEDFEVKKNELSEIIENYRTTKQEYEQVVAQFSAETAENLLQMQESDLKDIYDVDFLWTIVGNYATEEGINLKFDVNRNMTSASSINNVSTNYVICDLKFVITGNYINLTDFIYDLEDDDRLNFEINDFDMQKSEPDLQVTLTVKEVKINSDNLIQTASNVTGGVTNTVTQTIDSTTSGQNQVNNTTNSTNTINTTNSTNTTNQSSRSGGTN